MTTRVDRKLSFIHIPHFTEKDIASLSPEQRDFVHTLIRCHPGMEPHAIDLARKMIKEPKTQRQVKPIQQQSYATVAARRCDIPNDEVDYETLRSIWARE